MKYPVSRYIFTLWVAIQFVNPAFCQEKESYQTNSIFKASLFQPSLAYERDIMNNVSLDLSAGINVTPYNYQDNHNYFSTFLYFPYIKFEPRFYTTALANDQERGAAFSGVYFAPQAKYGFGTREVVPWYSIGSMVGYQGNYMDFLFLKVATGVSWMRFNQNARLQFEFDLAMGVYFYV